MANEIGNEKDIETIDRYIQELSKIFKSNFNNIFAIVQKLYELHFSKLLHERETARRSYNAPTNAIAVREREVLDRILESGKIVPFDMLFQIVIHFNLT